MSIKVMKQALDAIATGKGKFEAITALRQAIEQAEKVEPVGIVGHELWGKFVADITGKVAEGDKLYLHPPTAPEQPFQPDWVNYRQGKEDGKADAQQPLTDEQIEKGREQTFSVNNPYCPCDSKTMRKAVRWAEAAHGIKGEKS